VSSNFSHVTKWSGFVKQGWSRLKTNSNYQPGKRLFALTLLGFTGFTIANSQLSCPIWSAGCACPTCGITRATKALLVGDIQQAFFYQAFFPYWLFIALAIGLSFLAYVVGVTRQADTLGKKVLDSIPPSMHYGIWILSLLVNWYRYGINPEGWFLQFINLI
jgi:hypothetical protein